MRRCIVHIGTHKTGSTSLQRFLRVNRTALEHVGVLYPLEPSETAHHNLFREIKGSDAGMGGETTLQRLSSHLERTDADVVILSSELFSTIGPGTSDIKPLADIVVAHGFSIEAVLFVRPQHVLFNSMYGQRVKMLAEGGSFNEYVTRQQRRSMYDFNLLTAPWNVSPFANLTAIPFTLSEIGGGLDKSFFDKLGLLDRLESMSISAPLVPANLANGPRTVELCRRLSALGGKKRFGRNYLRVRRFAQREADRRNWNRPAFVGLSDDLRDQLLDHYRNSNDAFAERFWETPWETVFGPDYQEHFFPNELGVADLSEDSLTEVGEVYERACSRYDPVRLAQKPFLARISTGARLRFDGLLETIRKDR